jgi:hypothetical protein
MARRRRIHYTNELKSEIWKKYKRGESLWSIARSIDSVEWNELKSNITKYHKHTPTHECHIIGVVAVRAYQHSTQLGRMEMTS